MTDRTFLTFDDSLPLFVQLVSNRLGADIMGNATFLRDAFGRLSLVVDEKYRKRIPDQFGAEAKRLLGKYVDDAEFVVVTPQQLFDESLCNRHDAIRMCVTQGGHAFHVWVVDRRAVGAEWLSRPVLNQTPPPRVIFSSLKGGVGRTTALCVVAAHLASRGKRVLAIDLDIEAPGLGNMLLSDDTLPKFGLLDYLVERGLGPVPDSFLVDVMGPSWLAAGRGRIDVVPAIGKSSNESPENVVAKIARAYITQSSGSDDESSFAASVREFIKRLTADGRYDLVLIDARSGLHETTASALLGLGGVVYLFGGAQLQTFAGFNLLIANLALRAPASSGFWDGFRIIQSKSSSLTADKEFVSTVRALLNRYLCPVAETAPDLIGLTQSFDVDWSESVGDEIVDELVDSDAGSVPFIAIRDDPSFRHFDPIVAPSLLEEESYRPSFSDLLSDIESLIVPASE